VSVPERRAPVVRPVPLSVAAGLTGLFALATIILGVGSALQFHGRFSAGVGIMLVMYGSLLGWIAYAAWRQRFYIRGALLASALLNLGVAVSSLSSNVPLWSLITVLSAVIVVCSVLPSTTLALRRSRGDRTDDLPEV
jgi:hypothetical protein